MPNEKCPQCGEVITSNTGFCSNCGAPTAKKQKERNEVVAKQYELTVQKEEKNMQIVFVLGLICAILPYLLIISTVIIDYSSNLRPGEVPPMVSVLFLSLILSILCGIYLIYKNHTKYRKYGIILLIIIAPLLFELFIH